MLIRALKVRLEEIYCSFRDFLRVLEGQVDDLGQIVCDSEKLIKEDKEGSDKECGGIEM